MNSNLFFLLIACVSVSFTIIIICNGPVINGLVSIDRTENCQYYRDDYNNDKKTISNLSEKAKKIHLRKIHKCDRNKAMYGLEYASFIMDIVFGFICALLGLLNYFGAAKSFEKIIGLIGIISGIICFIITLVYICYSGYIFTNDSDGDTIKLDNDNVLAEYKDGTYSCKYYDTDDSNAIYAKYNELGKKQYNYNKDNYFPSEDNSECILNEGNLKTGVTYFDDSDISNFCSSPSDYIDIPLTNSKNENCQKIYYNIKESSISNKYNYDRWVTSIIFGVFVIACHIGLALFGFLIFKNGGSGGHTPL